MCATTAKDSSDAPIKGGETGPDLGRPFPLRARVHLQIHVASVRVACPHGTAHVSSCRTAVRTRIADSGEQVGDSR
eukprot:3844501-Rhodomonas_salina.2